MKRNVQIVLFSIILIVGFIARFYKLGSVPNGLYQDETAIGYNAYSILTTGKDEYGKSFPLYFKSFGDWKLPVYIYATVPSVKLFGLTPFAVRFPSALFSFLTLPILYLLVKRLTEGDRFALVAMFLLSINPWHIHYGRATFEVSISLFLFLAGTLLIYDAFSKAKRGYFFVGTLCFILALYSYNLTRLLSPILFILVFWLFHKKNKILKAEYIITAIIAIIKLIPFTASLLGGGGVGSSTGTLIFTSAAVQAPLLEFRSYIVQVSPFFAKLFFNTITLTLWQFLNNCTAYLSVPFLFISGSSHGNHGIGNVGELYLLELPTVLIGIWLFIKQKNLLSRLLFSWTVITIAVASLTRDVPQATRSFFLIFPLIIFSGAGCMEIIKLIKEQRNKIFRVGLYIIAAGLFLFNIIYYLSSYYIRFPIAYAKDWRSEDKELSLFIRTNEDKYDKIIIDPKAGFIYSSYLFYTDFSPTTFQATVKRLADDSEGFSQVYSIGKIEFREVNWNQDYTAGNNLIITTPNDKPNSIPSFQTFYYPNRPVVIADKQNILNYPTQDTAYVAIQSKNHR